MFVVLQRWTQDYKCGAMSFEIHGADFMRELAQLIDEIEEKEAEVSLQELFKPLLRLLGPLLDPYMANPYTCHPGHIWTEMWYSDGDLPYFNGEFVVPAAAAAAAAAAVPGRDPGCSKVR